MCNLDVESTNRNLDPQRLRDECIITAKVYDSCRQQDCLTPDVLGPSRATETAVLGGVEISEGSIIVPPNNAATVSIENLCLGNVVISEKTPSQFRNGFWDITIKYSFKYTLIFREADSTLIGSINAISIFTKKVSLFGSTDTSVQIVTDLLDNPVSSGPHILVEAKAVSLAVDIDFCQRNCCCETAEPIGVNVTIGLFTIIKLYRIVNLRVESRGFCVPSECEETSPINVCDFFDGLDFPLDLFAPPQKPEFFAGISNNIPSNTTSNNSSNNNCNCGCNSRPSNSCGCNSNSCCNCN